MYLLWFQLLQGGEGTLEQTCPALPTNPELIQDVSDLRWSRGCYAFLRPSRDESARRQCAVAGFRRRMFESRDRWRTG
jgi:hypothetical protein